MRAGLQELFACVQQSIDHSNRNLTSSKRTLNQHNYVSLYLNKTRREKKERRESEEGKENLMTEIYTDYSSDSSEHD